MNEFEIVTVIDRPVDQVFAFLVDAGTASDWNPGLTEARQTSDGPVGVGTTVLYIGKFLGRSYESLSECTGYVANEMRTAEEAVRLRKRGYPRRGAENTEPQSFLPPSRTLRRDRWPGAWR